MDQEKIVKLGLTSHKAKELLKQYGANEIAEKKTHNLLKSLLNQFNNFLMILLIAAGVISLIFGEIIDGAFIFLIVILNTCFGLYQEFKADRAIKALKNLAVSKVRTIRDHREIEIESTYLVPNDVIYIEEGAKIPADCTLIHSRHLQINEAALTGESMPVSKNENTQERLLYMGTVVAHGRAYAKVEKTGMTTKFGQIAHTLSDIKDKETPLQKKLAVFSKQIGAAGIAASFLVFLLSFFQNKSVFESFLFAISLAVAAVPEGLPAVMTITFAIGTERMSRKKAIIRKLNAIETLGSVTLVATDKTGTLTTNQMRVKKLWTYHKGLIEDDRFRPDAIIDKILLNSILCSTATLVEKVDHGDFDIVGDPTEGALIFFAHKIGYNARKIKAQWKTLEESLFNPATKRMSVIVEKLDEKKERYVFTKGAPESILSICSKVADKDKEYSLDKNKKEKIQTLFEDFAKKGLRMIAFSYKEYNPQEEFENDQVFLGFVGIADPIRAEVKEAVNKALNANIKVVMITGDNHLTAEAIGIEAGIIKEGEDILTGQQLDQFTDDQLISLLPRVKIFARTTPEHKYRLIKLFQKQNEVVAVTGDGVNDALALKQADVGVAMGKTGTDVVKETADMVITDDNFATLINAIEEGRHIFNNIKNVIKYLLTSNTAEVCAVLLGVLLKLPLMITAIQILYINLVTDGLPALSLAFSPKEKNIMQKSPRRTMTILERSDFKYILFLGFFGGLLTLASFMIGLKLHDIQFARTMAFTTLTLIQPLILIDLWLSHRLIIGNINLLAKPIFILSFVLPFILQPLLIYQSFFQQIFKTRTLEFEYFAIAFGLSLIILLPIEIKKLQKSSRSFTS